MTESRLQSACLKLLRAELRGAVILKHSERFSSGVPDVSITWQGKTSFWEFKYGPRLVWANGLQKLTCRRLAIAGTCYVVSYYTASNHPRTCIGAPDDPYARQAEGFNHRFVVDFVKKLHAP